MTSRLITFLLLLSGTVLVYGSGQAEAASGSGARGQNYADQRKIIPPEEVAIDSYVASVDYGYPSADGPLSLTVHSGTATVQSGQNCLLLLGIKGMAFDPSSMPPLNICFVIDASGSMVAAKKIDWIREGLEIFLPRIRSIDTVSIVASGDSFEVVLEPSNGEVVKHDTDLIRRIRGVRPHGACSIPRALSEGYSRVEKHYDSRSVNRVVFLSDGGALVGKANTTETESTVLAERYAKRGIRLTTVGFGDVFNLNQMMELARAGGGSSRFIPDRGKLSEIFTSDFPRMVVQVATGISLECSLMPGVSDVKTWGYEGTVSGNRITCGLPALHAGDYETILLSFRLPDVGPGSSVRLLTAEGTFTDLSGRTRDIGPYSIIATSGERLPFEPRFSDPVILKAATMLSIAESIREIGSIYYETLKSPVMGPVGAASSNLQIPYRHTDTPMDRVMERERSEEADIYTFRMRRALDLTLLPLADIREIETVLDERLYGKEESILGTYIDILSQQVRLKPVEIDRLKRIEERRTARQPVNAIQAAVSLAREIEPFIPPGSTVRYSEEAISDGGSGLFRAVTDGVLYELSIPGTFKIGTGMDSGTGGADFLLVSSIRERAFSFLVFLRLYRNGKLIACPSVVIPR